MNELEKMVNEVNSSLFSARYINRDFDAVKKIWDSVKNNEVILKEACKIVKDKWDHEDTFLSVEIVRCMLIDYREPYYDENQLSFHEEFYILLQNELIKNICSNKSLARIVLDGFSNCGDSFLMYIVMNNKIVLDDKQKEFIISEAMNKIGTKKEELEMLDFEKYLDSKSITDDTTVVDPNLGPIGTRTYMIYRRKIIKSLSKTQAHGRGRYDIRYYILNNPNFKSEFDSLVNEFYGSDSYFEEVFEEFENNLVSECECDDELRIYKDEFDTITKEEIFKRLPLEKAISVSDEIDFIKRARNARTNKANNIQKIKEFY